MSRADPYGGLITFATEHLAGFEGQVHMSCSECGWARQAVNSRVAREFAGAHVGAEHGVKVPAPQSRPGQAIPAAPAGSRGLPPGVNPWNINKYMARRGQGYADRRGYRPRRLRTGRCLPQSHPDRAAACSTGAAAGNQGRDASHTSSSLRPAWADTGYLSQGCPGITRYGTACSLAARGRAAVSPERQRSAQGR